MTPALLLGVALGLGAPALKEKEKPPSLVGEWVIQECTVGGKPSPPGSNPNRWVFNTDGTRKIVGPDGKDLVGGQYANDPQVGTLDLDSNQPIDAQYLCLFKVEGDTLTLNVGWQKAGRPAAFESPLGSQC